MWSGYLAYSVFGKGNKELASGIVTILKERHCLVEVHIFDLGLVFILLFSNITLNDEKLAEKLTWNAVWLWGKRTGLALYAVISKDLSYIYCYVKIVRYKAV